MLKLKKYYFFCVSRSLSYDIGDPTPGDGFVLVSHYLILKNPLSQEKQWEVVESFI